MRWPLLRPPLLHQVETRRKMAPITLYFLQASRSIRTAWLLEELGLEYEVKFADRENQKAPQWMKDEAGGLGKFPVLKDGETLLYESGNITERVGFRAVNPECNRLILE